MRLFIAVSLSARARSAIQSAIDEFPVKNPPWRWVSPDNWHLTLKFLGETPPAQIDPLKSALNDVAKKHEAFEMALGAFGGFPNLRNPRVLFYNIERGARELEGLARAVDAAVERVAGLEREKRRFQAHVTVARVKDPLPSSMTTRLAAVPALAQAVAGVHSFELMESRLARTGATYSVVKEFALS
ncbi:MAG TPA: RNA 2',3'-cyclic phosphodiesterase [Candidatus Krumholzibacteria bacterium]|nr:RNA 2',3'-cyclic phosphodiesterase [Candidatus Krumholzibacteria bacterium]